MWSEFFSFLGGCVATGFTIKIVATIKKHNEKSNSQTGSNIAKESSVAAGTINAPVTISNFHGNAKPEAVQGLKLRKKNYLDKQKAF